MQCSSKGRLRSKVKKGQMYELMHIFDYFPWKPNPKMNINWKREVAGLDNSSREGEDNILMYALRMRPDNYVSDLKIVNYLLSLRIFKRTDVLSKNEKGETIDEMGRKAYGEEGWEKEMAFVDGYYR